MAWTIEYTPTVEKSLARLDKSVAARILRYMEERVARDPKASGRALRGPLKGFWRWKVGDWRIIARIKDEEILVLVVRIAHRSSVYKGGRR